jgi:SAM-dependent methyltransferase
LLATGAPAELAKQIADQLQQRMVHVGIGALVAIALAGCSADRQTSEVATPNSPPASSCPSPDRSWEALSGHDGDVFWTAEHAYGEFPRVEEEFGTSLDVSRGPCGPDQLYDIVDRLGLRRDAVVLDVGCGVGRHAARLRERFGFAVTGIDPVFDQLAVARDTWPNLAFVVGRAEALPVVAGSVDLVWCRDVLIHVPRPDTAYAEFHRVLRPGGHAVVYQMFATDLLEPGERRFLVNAMGISGAAADAHHSDAAIAASGLQVLETYDIGSEWGEYAEEHSGIPGRNLLRAARLLRHADEYRARYGHRNYDTMLGDCLWHVYAMIGKLTRRAILLTKP